MEPVANNTEIQNWWDEFGVIPRTPRPGRAGLLKYLRRSLPVNASLREHKKSTDLIVRFPSSSRTLPIGHQKAYSAFGMSISDAFEEIVWNSIGTGTKRTRRVRTSFWARLAEAAYEAYWEAWMHRLNVAYRNRYRPEIDSKMGKWLHKLADVRKRRTPGRRREEDAERKSLLKRFKTLSRWSRGVHDCVENGNRRGKTRAEIRETIFRQIHGQRHETLILTGRAFSKIEQSKEAVLHDASTWKPKKLAIALLAFERSNEYTTIERKIGEGRRKKNAS